MDQQGLTLREWVKKGPFSLTLSQGWFCFPTLVGALLAIEAALNDMDGDSVRPPADSDALRPLRSVIHSCSGSSSGALVGAFVAAGIPLRSLPKVIQSLDDPADLVDVWGDSGLFEGGLVSGRRTIATLRESLGAPSFSECHFPFGVSAFHIGCRPSRVAISSGDVLAAVLASSCVPGLFAPQRLRGADGSRLLLTDVAFFMDASGSYALPSLPKSGRCLSIVAGDWNLDALSRVTPSSLPARLTAGGVRPQVVSLTLTGITRVMPWAVARDGEKALLEADLGVRRALDRPLRLGHDSEMGHLIVDMTSN